MDISDYSYRPTEQEVKLLVAQLSESEYLPIASQYLYPELTDAQLREVLAEVKDVDEFQCTFMFRFCQFVANNTISPLSHEGLEKMKTLPPSVIISNHRDIVVDALMLQYLRICAGMTPTNVVIGANLFEMPLMRLLARLNKMVPLQRGGTKREQYNAFSNLSEWIRRRVGEGESVWIAQRNGRTKDGLDRTEEALLKMLAMSGDRQATPGDGDPSAFRINALAALNLVPMSISYEWEPCGVEKARELALKQLNGTYQKAPGEDTKSIVNGILKPKGRVHLALGTPLTRADLEATGGDPSRVAELLDDRIIAGYRLWPNNYIAADILGGSSAHASQYTAAQRAAFEDYINKACDENPVEGFLEILLGIYANPLKH